VPVTLLSRVRTALRETRSLENPSYPLTSSALIDLFAAPNTYSGVRVDAKSAQRVIAVYRAWSLIACTIGSLPILSFSGDPPSGSLWNGDQAYLLRYPGGRDPVSGIPYPGTPTALIFFETLVVHLMSWGNAYIVKIPSEVGGNRVVALDLLAPDHVQPRWVRRTAANPAGKAFFVSDPITGELSVATPNDIIHIRALGHDLLQGISPIGAARQALGLAVAAEEYGARLFGSGNLMAGILQTDQRLDEAQARRLKERWKNKLQGLATAHDVAVLDLGAKWQPIGIPPQDSQFIQSREFAVTEVARLYGIPPHMMSQVDRTTSWGTGIQEQSVSFNTYTLRPWLARIETSLSNELLPRGVNCRFNVAELLRGDMKEEIAAHQAAVFSGQETPNEARVARGLPPVSGGDELFFPVNYATIDRIVNPPTPVPAVPEQQTPDPSQPDLPGQQTQPAQQQPNSGGQADGGSGTAQRP
jgi:HK97 family phage portal protein